MNNLFLIESRWTQIVGNGMKIQFEWKRDEAWRMNMSKEEADALCNVINSNKDFVYNRDKEYRVTEYKLVPVHA
jgi:hypothetical protein